MKSYVTLLLAALMSLGVSPAADTLRLDGEWQLQLDREDRGIRDQWFNKSLPERIQLPGVLQSQGFGNEISIHTPWVLSLYDRLWYLREDYQAFTNAGNVKVPFVCQPPLHFFGAAWFQKEIQIPAEWAGRRVKLHLERPRWESRVWIDGTLIGTNNSLCAPHEFALGVVDAVDSPVRSGKQRLVVRVDNRMLLPYRPDAHAVSDSLNSTWNGIVGKMELQSTPAVWIEDLQVFPDSANGTVKARVRVGNANTSASSNRLTLNFFPRLASGGGKPEVREMVFQPGWTSFEVDVQSAGAVKVWDEFQPALYEFTANLTRANDGGDADAGQVRRVTFGFRDLKRDGTRLMVNGRETHFRGTHHGGDFPMTGYPPTDVEYWRQLIRTCQQWGMNHMRFHSFCPPKAAFEAADELGFYLQPEPGMWNTIDPNSPMERMLYIETERMLKEYGNHPSFVMFAASNEPKGRWRQVLPKWAAHFREIDGGRRLYTTGTGFTDSDAPGPIDQVDYSITQRFGPRQVRREPGWFGRDYSSSLRGVTVPVIAHENGQWCAYPDFSVIEKFKGYMRPGNYEIFRASAAANGVLERNRDFAWASGRFQLACYKEEIEANLRTPGLAGFQLLDLHDYVGQGSALVGLLDPFWESKGYVTAEEFRRFCSRTVPLARLRQRTFTTADSMSVDVEVAHFGSGALSNQPVNWSIRDSGGKTMMSGNLGRHTLLLGRSPVGQISSTLSNLPAPAAYRLVISIPDAADAAGGTPAENDWNFWVYPARDTKALPADVLVTGAWIEAEKKLSAGGKVLFVPSNADLDWSSPPLDDVPVFWNRLMNPSWSRMLGLWCDTNHPALRGFPTESNCDWQWTQIVRGVRPMNLAKFPRDLQPIVQAIDDWNRNWKLGAVFECRVGSGRLVVSTFNVISELEERPVARQLRRSLLDYMASDAFDPKVRISAAEFRESLFNNRVMRQLGARAKGEGNVNQAIDGDPNTAWVTGGTGRNASGTRHPHVLTIEFPQNVAMTGVVLMPRQNDRDHLGDVREFQIEVSADGESWEKVHEGSMPSSWSPKRLEWGRAINASHLRFTALSGYGNDASIGIADIAVLMLNATVGGSGDIEFQRSRSTSTDVDEGQ